jgi:pilus assembly protein CpaF
MAKQRWLMPAPTGGDRRHDVVTEAFGSLLDDPHITEIMVNGPGPVWVERSGRLERLARGVDASTLGRLIETLVSEHGRRVDPSSPIVDTRLADGSRLCVVVPPVAVDGACLTIRRFRRRPVALEELADDCTASLLHQALQHRMNLVVVGATGSGKTTVLNALLSRLDDEERLITVEDAAELSIASPHVVRLETRPASPDGVGEITVRALVRAALRMRPDRIVVGEVRGAEVRDMCQAMHTGHDGSMTTCHANGPHDAMLRLESMLQEASATVSPLAARGLLVSAIDLLVWVRRTGGARRTIAAVHELRAGVDGADSRAVALVEAGVVVDTPQRLSRRSLVGAWWS